MNPKIVAIFLLIDSCAFGQLPVVPVVPLSCIDTIVVDRSLNGDSLYDIASDTMDSTARSYDNTMGEARVRTACVQAQIDSLRKLNEPVGQAIDSLDAIRKRKDEEIRALNAKLEAARSKASKKIDSLAVPLVSNEEAQHVRAVVNEAARSSADIELPSLPQEGVELLGIEGVPTIEDVNLDGVGADLRPHIDAPPATLIEEQATRAVDATNVDEQLREVEAATVIPESLQDESSVKQALEQKVQQETVDLFQGKREQLHEAMKTLSKYKKQYSRINSLDQIPKKRPNPLHNKPFTERLVPGIWLQIHRKDGWMVDFNVYAGYRFNPRLMAGAGWNQRLAYNPDAYEFNADLRVYGPRVFSDFAMGRGFSVRLESEYMNTRIPPRFSAGGSDSDGRGWVYSTLAGIKKEYRFLGKVKGTMLFLYNLHDRRDRSPYSDKLMMRFGFEFPMKKGKNH